MTFEERMAELGVDLSDLPMSFPGGPEAYNYDRRKQELSAAWEWYLPLVGAPGDLMTVILTHKNVNIAAQYIAHLIDIIDRMEMRIVNLTGERDYLLTQVEEDCMICANAEPEYHMLCAKYDILPDECFEFEGVPEDWRPNDE